MTERSSRQSSAEGLDLHLSVDRTAGFVGRALETALREGEMIFELEGEPERVIRAGEALWEPVGDVIHYQAANNLTGQWSRFVVVMLCVPGQPILVYVDDEELSQRSERRAPRPLAS